MFFHHILSFNCFAFLLNTPLDRSSPSDWVCRRSNFTQVSRASLMFSFIWSLTDSTLLLTLLRESIWLKLSYFWHSLNRSLCAGLFNEPSFAVNARSPNSVWNYYKSKNKVKWMLMSGNNKEVTHHSFKFLKTSESASRRIINHRNHNVNQILFIWKMDL